VQLYVKKKKEPLDEEGGEMAEREKKGLGGQRECLKRSQSRGDLREGGEWT